ncbi:MAG: class I SAM-dependent methyltransferase [Candidatus Omnitrophica bacterium]|nr:class I SAM-dependent methyltransferase [Candidatus Omnitrophota bacterium]
MATALDRLYAWAPWLYRYAMSRGWIAEHKWIDIGAERFDDYLADSHPDRAWFVNWCAAQRPCTVLEIGAGAMHEIKQLRALGHLASDIRYTVMDIAPQLLAEGRKHLPDVTFVKGSINRIPLPDDAFDLVCCRAVLEHQPGYRRPIEEMLRVSRRYVVVNLFRWAMDRDVIARGKYYSNAYHIEPLLAFAGSVSGRVLPILIPRGNEPGLNRYEDPTIRRNGDHLVLVMAKRPDDSLDGALQWLERLGIRHMANPDHQVLAGGTAHAARQAEELAT